MIIYTSIAILNVITFFLYGIDKWKAKKKHMEEHETYWVCPVCGAIVDK